MTIEIVDNFPLKMMIFHSYVKLPEGKFPNFPNSQGFLLPAAARAASTSAWLLAGALGLAGAGAAGGAGAYRGNTEEVPFAPSGDGHGVLSWPIYG